jgi:hypothetical protein
MPLNMRDGYAKWRKQLILLDKIISVAVIILLGIFKPDFFIIGIYFLIFPYLFLTKRKYAMYHLLVSSAVAIIWISIANDQYGYNQEMITFIGINLYPLFAWTVGLFGHYMIYSNLGYVNRNQSLFKKFLLYLVFYFPVLIAVETIAYHLLNIENIATAAYTGLPFCDCIHAPRWMQISYLFIGPVFFGICELIGLENPNNLGKIPT